MASTVKAATSAASSRRTSDKCGKYDEGSDKCGKYDDGSDKTFGKYNEGSDWQVPS